MKLVSHSPLWYNIFIITTKTPNCSQCGSPLVLVSKVTEKLEGYRYPQTSTVYRCSNQPCQEEKDKETAKRIRVKEDRAMADKKREDLKTEKKLNKEKKADMSTELTIG